MSWRIRSSAARRNASSCSGTGKCAPQCSHTAAVQALRLLHQEQRFCSIWPSGASENSWLLSTPGLAITGESTSATPDENCSEPKPLGVCIGGQVSVGASVLPRRACPQTPQKLASGALLAPHEAQTCPASCSNISMLLSLGCRLRDKARANLQAISPARLPTSQRYQSGFTTRPVISFG